MKDKIQKMTPAQEYAKFLMEQYPNNIPLQVRHVEAPDVVKARGSAFLAEVVIDLQLMQEGPEEETKENEDASIT